MNYKSNMGRILVASDKDIHYSYYTYFKKKTYSWSINPKLTKYLKISFTYEK